MHRYALEPSENRAIEPWMVVLGLLSVAFAWGTNRIFAEFETLQNVRFIDAPSAIAFFGVSYKIFDRVLWRWPILKRLGLATKPDLNGKWTVRIRPSGTVESDGIPATFSIYQTYTQISLALNSSISSSNSIAASIEVINPGKIVIRNQYVVDPRPDAPASLRRHEGTNRILITVSGRAIRPEHGSYYTEAQRNTHGTLKFD